MATKTEDMLSRAGPSASKFSAAGGQVQQQAYAEHDRCLQSPYGSCNEAYLALRPFRERQFSAAVCASGKRRD